MADAVTVLDVKKHYRQGDRDVFALRRVSLVVPQGQFLAIMGSSGSGKSTLLHLCAALDRPDSGSISVAGEQIEKLSERRLTLFRRRRIGVIFQQFNLIPTLNVQENIALPALLDGSYSNGHMKRIDLLMDMLRISHRADHRPDALSGGEQQRVAIARALLLEPPVLFADEPTGNLDSNNSEQFWILLHETVKAFKTTIMMVTHEPSAAQQADRVVVLKDGVVAGEFPVTPEMDGTALAGKYQAAIR